MTLGERLGVETLAFDGVRPGVEVVLGGGLGGGDMSRPRSSVVTGLMGERWLIGAPTSVLSGFPTGLGLAAIWLPGSDSVVAPEIG